MIPSASIVPFVSNFTSSNFNPVKLTPNLVPGLKAPPFVSVITISFTVTLASPPSTSFSSTFI